MKIESIEPVSAGKINGLISACAGLLAGVFWTLFTLLGAGLSSEFSAVGGGGTVLFGAAAIVFMPILYGILGFIGGVLFALLYNLVARVAGGLEITLGE